jgi:hypothetical protein
MSSIQQFQESLKDASLEELLAIIAAATAEAKKKAKIVVKAPKKEAKEKKGSMPKGVVPPQLVKPRAYVDYTLADANKNGWEAFEISGQPFAASVQKEDGTHVFEATGKPFNHKHAMSLSKIRKTKRPEFYQAFDAQHVEPAPSAPAAESEESDGEEKSATAAVSAPKPKKEKAAPKPKKTDEEKAAEKEAKKEAKKAEKKTAKKAEKEVSSSSSSSSSSALTPRPLTPAAVDTWVPKTTDGKVYPRTIGGVVYFSNHLHQLWTKELDGGVGDWAGVFLVSENRIDATAEEPMYD